MKITIYIEEKYLENFYRFISGEITTLHNLRFHMKQPIFSTLITVTISYNDYIILKEWEKQ